jgi:hypothetical protein
MVMLSLTFGVIIWQDTTPGGKIMARGTSGAASVHLKSSYTKFKVIF